MGAEEIRQQEEDEIYSAAKAAHEVNRVYCESHGDMSQPKWADAPKWQRDSAASGVRMIMADQDTTPRKSHEGWLAVKQAEGWKYGPVKDVEAKTHPCFVPYDQLPPQQRFKDELFGIVVRASLGIL